MKKSHKESAIRRLRLLEGQIRGLEKMVEEERYCIDIITQSSAVKAGLSAFENVILENHLETHVVDQMAKGQTKKVTEEILSVYRASQRK